MKKYLILLLLTVTSCGIKSPSEHECRYDVVLYYLGGSTDTVSYEVNEVYEPYIQSNRGDYTFVMSAIKPGSSLGVLNMPIIAHRVPGVVRFKVLHKERIK